MGRHFCGNSDLSTCWMMLRIKPPSDEGGAPKGRRERKCCVFSRTPCKTQALFSPPVNFADSPLVRGGLERTEITILAFGIRHFYKSEFEKQIQKDRALQKDTVIIVVLTVSLFAHQEADVLIHHFPVSRAQLAPRIQMALFFGGKLCRTVVKIEELLQRNAKAVADLEQCSHGRGGSLVQHGTQGGVGNTTCLGQTVNRPRAGLTEFFDPIVDLALGHVYQLLFDVPNIVHHECKKWKIFFNDILLKNTYEMTIWGGICDIFILI